MQPATTRFLKIDLEKQTKRCGTCKFCAKYEILIYPEDVKRLKRACQAIIDKQADGTLLRSGYVVDVLVIFEKVQNEKLYCEREKCWTRFLDKGCGLWRLREPSV